MRVITAPNDYSIEKDEISVFLAGGISNCQTWQKDVISRLEEKHLKNLVVLNPRRENFPINDENACWEQISWEFRALEEADIFSMYFASGESDQPICMYELGRNIVRKQIVYPTSWKDRIVITIEEGYLRKQDVKTQTALACGGYFTNTCDGFMSKGLHANLIASAYRKLELRRKEEIYDGQTD